MASVENAIYLLRQIGRYMKRYEELLAVVGALYASKITFIVAWKVLQGFRVYILSRLRQQDFKGYGKWAVITGGTDGIGKAYCREFANHGLNIVIISRSLDKLKATAEELEKDFGISTSIIQADFTEGTRSLYTNIKEQLADKEIGILGNFVTCNFHPLSKTFASIKLWQCINVNMTTVTMMTYIVLPQMAQRRKGLIINMSSISSFYPLPLMAAYSASKAYVDWFSRALNYEYKSKGITIQTLLPSYISTKLTRFSHFLQKPGYIVPDAHSFVNSALCTVGTTNRTTGYWTHGLQWWWYEHMPESLWNLSSWVLLKMLDSGELRLDLQKKKHS
ncbi:inactive hydroxysteroid dehydrogenase-like protein 1 [Limulus polyphemus]|uniref:Inactive hydroxysteroid dehydrogenase-like protein 1 n=1 Tax=Limulus polyphemus TaxID=6850 RepID=A0ABM1B2F0_LIMPO|nr:inactive hydroxysteroid dehydrogenase-like protein 1 [Limulus polyphemus]